MSVCNLKAQCSFEPTNMKSMVSSKRQKKQRTMSLLRFNVLMMVPVCSSSVTAARANGGRACARAV